MEDKIYELNQKNKIIFGEIKELKLELKQIME